VALEDIVLRRLIGLPRTPGTNDGPPPADARGSSAISDTRPAAGRSRGSTAETATVREIVAKLESMPPDEARFLAGFAYILSRTANADLHVTEDETQRMEQIVVEHGHVSEAQAIIVIQIAKTRAELFGPTEDYLVTREFRKVATDAQCLDLLRCCFLVGTADGTISAEESGTLSSIADELAVDAVSVRRLRAEFAEQSAALQAMRKARRD
jgi:tellurite resistance protein